MRKTTVYAVFKQAVYRHECCGIFRTQEAAEACAQAVVEREDGHHGTEVVPFVLDQAGAMAGAGVEELSAVVRFHKDKYRPGGAVIRTEATP